MGSRCCKCSCSGLHLHSLVVAVAATGSCRIVRGVPYQSQGREYGRVPLIVPFPAPIPTLGAEAEAAKVRKRAAPHVIRARIRVLTALPHGAHHPFATLVCGTIHGRQLYIGICAGRRGRCLPYSRGRITQQGALLSAGAWQLQCYCSAGDNRQKSLFLVVCLPDCEGYYKVHTWWLLRRGICDIASARHHTTTVYYSSVSLHLTLIVLTSPISPSPLPPRRCPS